MNIQELAYVDLVEVWGWDLEMLDVDNVYIEEVMGINLVEEFVE